MRRFGNLQIRGQFNRWRNRALRRQGQRFIASAQSRLRSSGGARGMARAAAGGVADRVVGNMLSRVHPYAGMAYQGAKWAYRGYKAYRDMKSSSRGRRGYATTGHYQGKFKKVTRKGRSTGFDSYNVRGVVSTDEIIGSVTDQDCVYLANEVFNSRDLIYYLAAAMLRKLIEMGGGRVTGNNEACFSPLSGAAESANYHIRHVKVNAVTGSVTSNDYSFSATTEFQDIVEHFRNEFEQYCSGFGELANGNTDEPVRLILFHGNISEAQDIRAQMYFNETFVDCKGLCQMKVQNRTKATGGSEDAENINNNPLQGYSYLFQGVPKPKGNQFLVGGTNGSMFAFERMPYVKAVSSFGANVAGLNVNMKEPPNPKLFWNCSKASRIRLEPGAIKSFYCGQTLSGNILKILKKIRLQLDATGGFSTYSYFKVQMIALEDVINANAAETISIQYEVERKIGVKCYTKQKKFYKTEYHLVT